MQPQGPWDIKLPKHDWKVHWQENGRFIIVSVPRLFLRCSMSCKVAGLV